MTKIIEINNCKKCGYFKESAGLWHDRCIHPHWYTQDYKTLSTNEIRDIPEWCPLPNKEESK